MIVLLHNSVARNEVAQYHNQIQRNSLYYLPINDLFCMWIEVELGTLRKAGAFCEVLGQIDENLNVAPDARHAVRVAGLAIFENKMARQKCAGNRNNLKIIKLAWKTLNLLI